MNNNIEIGSCPMFILHHKCGNYKRTIRSAKCNFSMKAQLEYLSKKIQLVGWSTIASVCSRQNFTRLFR